MPQGRRLQCEKEIQFEMRTNPKQTLSLSLRFCEVKDRRMCAAMNIAR
jgi:hypothetical protein